MAIEIEVYEDESGIRPFDRWFATLPVTHAAKVTLAVRRMGHGHTSNLKALAGGISEWRIDWGPGLRIYLAYDGQRLILLLGGGTKTRQQDDIYQAVARWADFKRRKKRG